MLDFDDSRWAGLKGGYGSPYDPRPALRQLENRTHMKAAWDELWLELHHQGDVGEVSYAAVPHFVRLLEQSSNVEWNSYSLITTIEIERHRRTNPPMPVWLIDSYRSAWKQIPELGCRDLKRTEDQIAVSSILAALALAKGNLKLGAMLVQLDDSEIDEYVNERISWSDLYKNQTDFVL